MEKKRPYRKCNFGIENFVVMSILIKSLWKKEDHIENVILELKIML